MKKIKKFEDSAPFSLVIKQSVQENTYSEQQPFPGDPDSTLFLWAWEVSYETCCGNGMKRPKLSPSETIPWRASLSTIISLRD